MSTPATAGSFFDTVLRSGLLSEENLRPYRELESADSTLDARRSLAASLVKAGLLTSYQARQLLAGRTTGFYLANKYRVLDFLGTGGMGQVFLCEHLLLQRLVAVKVLQRAAATGSMGGLAAAVERFLREARAIAVLDHANIVRVFDMERSGSIPFMVMEYVDGASLHEIVSRRGPLPIDRAVDYARQAALGLQHAHEHGLIHRDIKPGNLLLDRAGTVKILDLGLARFLRDVARNADLTARFDDNKSVVGTADFMSPEQAMNSGTVDIRSDLYSLGATLYFLLTGRAPFENESLTQKLAGHQFRIPISVSTIRPEVLADLSAVVTKMLAKSPTNRFQDPAEAVEALRPWCPKAPSAPPALEMPTTPASDYRLGLSPAASSVSVGASADSGDSELPMPLETEARNADTPSIRDRETGPRLSPLNDSPTPTGPVPMEPVLLTDGTRRDAHASPKRRIPVRAMGLGLAVLLIGVMSIWLATRERPGQQSKSDPTVPGGDASAKDKPVDTGPGANDLVLTGSGSTFVKPAMDYWAKIYEQKTGVKIKYDGIGSGRGVDNMIDRVLDFGCTDAALTEPQIAKAREIYGEVVHIPLALGAVVPTFNLPDLNGQLRLTGPALADIFLGKIKKWNHPAIAASNPGLVLPNVDITVVHRSDSSGTTFIWTDYLQKASADWEKKVGAGTKVIWPLGEEGEKNDGVAKAISRKEGAIGYVELSFALERNLKIGLVKNQSGKYVEPTLESVTAAANASLRIIPGDLRFTLTDAPGEDSYPIAGTAWAVLYSTQTGPRGKELLNFLKWATHDGQMHLKELLYAPLPPPLVARCEEKIATLRTRE
jgi:eukaryotic-like serine/threonine-protein kinase